MCFGSSRPPDPPPLPEIQEPAEIAESGSTKGAQQRRNQLLVKGQKSPTGASPTGTAV